MFTSWDKAIVAIIGGILTILATWFGYDFQHVTEEALLTIIAILTPFFVWLVPNKTRMTNVQQASK